MKPTMAATTRTTRPKTDKWRYGERYQPCSVGPDGEIEYEIIPLRKKDLLFPQEGDRPVITDDHSRDCHYLFGVLDGQAKRHRGRRVFTDHRIDFQVPGIPPLGPDAVVLDDVGEWDGALGTFPVRSMGAVAQLGMEVTSEDSRGYDLQAKPILYFRCGVQCYAVIDRWAESGREVRVLAYRAGPDGYVAVPPDEHGRLWLEPVGLWLGIENRRATLYDENGRRIPAPEERAETETRARKAESRARKKAEDKAAALEERVRQLEADLRRKNGK